MSNEAAERLRTWLREVNAGDKVQRLDDALAAEREPLLAALKALVEAVDLAPAPTNTDWYWSVGKAKDAWHEARVLIEQDGRTEK